MNRWIYVCLIAGLFLLAAPAGASIPDTIEKLETSNKWVTAGSGETSTITAWVENNSSPLSGVTVTFAVDGTDGTVSPVQTVTDHDGSATVTFRPGTVAGTATITATVSHEGLEEERTESVEQKVDHTTPYAIANLWYEPEVTAGGETDITIRMVDRYGNPVDSRREVDEAGEAETVKFTVGSAGGGAAFIGGDTVPVDENGNATARLRVDTLAGENIVFVEFPGSIKSRYLTVIGLSNGEPSEIYQTVSPKVDDPNPDYYPELPLGEQFIVTYALYDEYGNPAGNRQISVNIRPTSGFLNSETLSLKTNSMGKAQFKYKSLDRIGTAEIIATALDNSSVSCKQRVGFYSADPTNIVLTAIPQTIASRDVKDDIVSSIRAKVVDSKGNPVQYEEISFRITRFDNGTFLMTDEPWISNDTSTSRKNDDPIVAITDMDGFATIYLHPGYFTRNTSDLLYDNMASGSATIQVEWEGVKKDTTVSFRNYPYLSVNVTVEPQVVAVNSTVDVTIQLIGDGWALQTKPVDVVLCTDRSGSMLQNTTYTTTHTGSVYNPTSVTQESIDDRMVHAMRAAKIFVSWMQSSKDRIGLVSFGQSGTADLATYCYKFWVGNDYKEVWHEGKERGKKGSNGYWAWEKDFDGDPEYIAKYYNNGVQEYNDSATRDLELTWTYKNVNTTIDNWIPCGGTPMRQGLYQSVQMILEGRSGRPESADPVEAIVLLTDGKYDSNKGYGLDQNPEGGSGNKQLGSGIGTGSVIDYIRDNGIKIFTIALGNEPSHEELQSYANKTGGMFYNATAGDDLTQVYADIATSLQEAASVNTTMDLAFDKVMRNSTPTEEVFDYVYDNPESTRMIKYWTENKTTIWGPECENQGEEWSAKKHLSFEVEDIYLHQTWETTFRLKVLKEGNIEIFGEDSIIKFNGTVGPTELGLPRTFITVSHNLSEFGAITSDIWLTQDSLTTDDTGIFIPSWNLTYTGNWTVTQKVMYQFSQDNVWWSGNWHVANTLNHPADTDINGTYSSNLDLREKKGWYKIRVFAQENAPDGWGASREITWMEPVQVGMSDRAYIKIG